MAFLIGYLALGSAISSNGVLTELSGNGYARKSLPITYDPVAGIMTFPGASLGPATGAWSAATVAAIFDAASNGNQIMSFPIPSYTAASGNTYTLPAGSIQVNLNSQVYFTNSGPALAPNTIFGVLTDNLGVNLNGAVVTSGPVTLDVVSSVLTAVTLTQTVTYAATIAPNAALGAAAVVTLTGNVTMNVWSNMVPGAVYRMEFIQDGTGSRLLTLGAGFKTAGGAPTLTTGAGSIDRYDFFYDGTTCWGVLNKAYA